MMPAGKFSRSRRLQSIEIVIRPELVFGVHLIGALGNRLRIIFNRPDNMREAVKLGEVLLWNLL